MVMRMTMTTNQVSFDTALGRCAVRWTDAGISGVLLPHRDGRPHHQHNHSTFSDASDIVKPSDEERGGPTSPPPAPEGSDAEAL